MGKKLTFKKVPLNLSLFSSHKDGYGEGHLGDDHIIYYYDKTKAFQQKKYNELKKKKYMMMSKTISGTGKNLRYAVIWRSVQNPEFKSFTVTGAINYQKKIEKYESIGYYPSLISVSGASPSKAVFSGTFEKLKANEKPPLCLYNLQKKPATEINLSSIDAVMKVARNSGLILASLSEYGTSSQPYFAGIWKTNTKKRMWDFGTREVLKILNDRCNGHKTHRARPALIVPGSGNKFSSLFTNDSVGSYLSHTVDSIQELITEIDKGRKLGYQPIKMDAYREAETTHYWVLLAKSAKPLKEHFIQTGVTNPKFAAWDIAIQSYMERNNVKSTSLAVAHKGKLVYAKGYSYQSDGAQKITPTTQFRTASVTKVITSIAVHRLIEDGKIKLDDAFKNYVPTENTSNKLYEFIQVGHVLSHRASFRRNHPNTEKIVKSLKVAIPVSIEDRRKWCRMQTLMPNRIIGLEYQYSNLGYTLLGQLIEKVSGTDYFSYVSQQILSPLGLTRPVIGPPWGDAKEEVRYEPKNLLLKKSAFIEGRDLVSQGYEGGNYPLALSSGGFVFSTVDMAKLLSAFHSNVKNPVLKPATVRSMLTETVATSNGYFQTYGWSTKMWTKVGGEQVRFYTKGGAYTTCTTRIDHREDDISFVFFTNKSLGLGSLPSKFHRAADKMKLGDWPTTDLFPTYGIPSF